VERQGTLLATTLCAGLALMQFGCSGASNPIDALSKAYPSSAPVVAVYIPEITTRTAEVAFISACAKAYGYSHDAGKLKSGYLAYETKRGATPAQVSALERSYEETYQGIDALGHRKANFCSKKDGEEMQAELRRYTSGFFEPRTPQPSAAAEDWKKFKGDPNCGARC
jgi:hypothetical protein